MYKRQTLSHVAVFEVKGIEQLLFLTDVAFMTYPTLEDKVHIIETTVAVAHACGVECPTVAPLAAVEAVSYTHLTQRSPGRCAGLRPP